MNIFPKTKARLFHPLKERTLFIIDFFCVILILTVYALTQYVYPSVDVEEKAVLTTIPVITEAPTEVPSIDVEVIENPEFESELVSDLLTESSSKFADKFSDSIILTSTLYKSPTISVEIISESEDKPSLQQWFIADIYVKDIRSLQSYVVGASTGGKLATRSIKELSADLGSIVAVNGDYAVLNNTGFAVRNGKILSSKLPTSDVCVMYTDGIIECFSAEEFDADDIIEKQPWQVWSFGPSLLDNNGYARTDFPSNYAKLLGGNPRTILGYYEPGHYCFVSIDGRQRGYASGMSMEDAAKLMENLGCKVAYNLDGGKSTQMTFGATYVNHPSGGGRFLSDILFVKDYTEEENN